MSASVSLLACVLALLLVLVGPVPAALADDEADFTISITAPSGQSFAAHDPLVCLYSGNELVFEQEGVFSTSSFAVVSGSVPAGAYHLVVKAGGCETLREEVAIAPQEHKSIMLQAQQPWSGALADDTWCTAHKGDDAFYLRAPEDFAALSDLVAGGESFAGKTLVMCGDMDFGGHTLTAIGYLGSLSPSSSSKAFSGTIEGDGYTLKNYYAQPHAADAGGFSIALFGYTKDATIQALNVKGASVITSGGMAAALVAYACDTTIDSCVIDATVRAGGSEAGIVCAHMHARDASGIIRGCTSRGTLRIETKGARYFGGIVGTLNDTCYVARCTNEANLTYAQTALSSSDAGVMGGIAGVTGIESVTIEECVNKGIITSNHGNVGGILGRLVGGVAPTSGAGAEVRLCRNEGTVTVTGVKDDGEAVGGIVGVCTSAGYASRVSRCWNVGAVSCTSDNEFASAGGVVGYMTDDSLVTVANCYNTGSVTVSDNSRRYAGGIVSVVRDGNTVENCYSVGAISGGSGTSAGAVCGAAFGAPVIRNTYYLNSSASRGIGTQADAKQVVQGRTAPAMKNAAFLRLLNVDGVWATDSKQENSGYPVIEASQIEAFNVTSMERIAPIAYTGNAANVAPVVRNRAGNVLRTGVDYELSYLDKNGTPIAAGSLVQAGTYYVVATGKGAYSEIAFRAVTIVPRTITQAMFTAGEVRYTGLDPVFDDVFTTELERDVDYTVNGFVSGKSVGKQHFRVSGKGNYRGDVELEFEIAPGVLSIAPVDNLTYNAEQQTPYVRVHNTANLRVTAGDDFTISYLDSAGSSIDAAEVKDAGTYTVVVTGVGNYRGSRDEQIFAIERAGFDARPLSDASYTGEPQSIEVFATIENTNTPVHDEDLSMTVTDASGAMVDPHGIVEAGVYSVTLAGIGNCTGATTLPFVVARAAFEVNPIEKARYSGTSAALDLRVHPVGNDEIELVEGPDYHVSYAAYDKDGVAGPEIAVADVRDAGAYRVRVEGAGSYEGVLDKTFVVLPAAITFAGVVPSNAYTGESNPASPVVAGVLGDARPTLVQSADYTLSYVRDGQTLEESEVVSAGTYSLVARGYGNYANSIDVSAYVIEKAGLGAKATTLSFGYDAKSHVPDLVAYANDVEFDIDRCAVTYHSVSYSAEGDRYVGPAIAADDVVHAGTYVARVTAGDAVKGDFTGDGMAEAEFTIQRAAPSVQAFDLSYTGKALNPAFSVLATWGGQSAQGTVAPADYTYRILNAGGREIDASEIVNAGTYTVLIRFVNGQQDFTVASVSDTFEVKKAVAGIADIPSWEEGSEPPRIIVRDEHGRAIADNAYRVEFKTSDGKSLGNKMPSKAGEYTVVVTMLHPENYASAELSATFVIRQKPVTTPTSSGLSAVAAPVTPSGAAVRAASYATRGATAAGKAAQARGGTASVDELRGNAEKAAYETAESDTAPFMADAMQDALAVTPWLIPLLVILALIAATLSILTLFRRRKREQAEVDELMM